MIYGCHRNRTSSIIMEKGTTSTSSIAKQSIKNDSNLILLTLYHHQHLVTFFLVAALCDIVLEKDRSSQSMRLFLSTYPFQDETIRSESNEDDNDDSFSRGHFDFLHRDKESIIIMLLTFRKEALGFSSVSVPYIIDLQ